MRVSRTLVVFMVTSALVVTSVANARNAGGTRVAVVSDTAALDVNELRLLISNDGMLPWPDDIYGGALEFPRGSGRNALYQGGPWIAAKVGNEIRGVVSEYSTEYGPGAILPGGAADRADKPEYRVYRLDRRYSDVVERDTQLAAYVAGAVPHGAPPVTVLPDGSLDIVGDEFLWTVFNDADAALHTHEIGSSAPLGIEIRQTAWAFHRPGTLDRVIFLRLEFLNKGQNTLDSTFIAYWTDPDLGGYQDDLAGADTSRKLVFAYNSTSTDEVYGIATPCLAVQLLRGARSRGTDLGMTSGGRKLKNSLEDELDSQELFRRLSGFDRDGSPFKDPLTGLPTKYVRPGDPVTGLGWLDSFPGDRRMLLSSGPFTMAPGDTQTIVLAIIVGQGGNRLASVGEMRRTADQVRDLWEHDMVVPVPPPAPHLVATPSDGEVVLTWDAASESAGAASLPFQGYNLYQAATPDGPFVPLATFDRVDGVTAVLGDSVDPETGLIVSFVAARGTDRGLSHSWSVTRDSVHSRSLVNGKRYWFALEAYSVDLTRVPRVLLSPRVVVEAVPQPPGGGIELASASVSTPVRGQRTSGSEAGTEFVTVEIVDTLAVRDAEYEVGFAVEPAGDTTWHVVRDPAGSADTLVAHEHDRSPRGAGRVFDGLRVIVAGQSAGELGDVVYETAGIPPLEGVDRGLRFLRGGADYGALAFASSVPARGDRTHNCELRFTGAAAGQYALRYLRTAEFGPTFYLIQDYVPVPFTVWDADANVQLNAAFLEQDGSANQDGAWNPDDSADGGREFVWVLDRPYFGAATPDSSYFHDSLLRDILYGLVDSRYFVALRARAPGAKPAAGDRLRFRLTRASGPNDLFRFTTHAATRTDVASARSALDRVLAVPNPYFLFSSYERTGSERIVRFTHLPVRCTIRLFDLAGSLVKVLQKNDDLSQAVWDLTNQAGRRVGSGVYIFHVDAPGVGTHIGKLAVLQR